MNDPFATLGLPARFDLEPAEIEQRVRELQRALHPDRYVGRPAQERRMSLAKAVEVNEAYRALRDDIARARALLAVRGIDVAEEQPAEPAFLMEVMERREALSEARGDLDRVRALAAEVRRDADRARAEIARLFADASSDPRAIAGVLGRMRYYRRFLDEVEAIEEASAGAAGS